MRMRYVKMSGAGGPELLSLDQMQAPQAGPQQVLIRVLAAGVNRPDLAQRQGLYPPPADASPILGLEVAGEIAAVGEGVTQWKAGDRVCALVHGGGYAEYALAHESHCLPWPKGFDAIRAAALPETFFTVWVNVFGMGALAPGETLLVHGGSSGIGTTAIQIAKALGSRVFVTAGSASKCEACVKLGADAAIHYREQDFEAEIRELTGKRGVDVILDMVGGAYLPKNLRCLALDGRIVMIATMQGAKVDGVDLREIMKRRARLTGSMLRPRSVAEKGEIAADLREHVWPLLNAGRVAPVIERVFAFEDIAKAHAALEAGSHVGKIMLKLGD
ncbi:NAD(P)H-quinone oxidoreductase [Hydrocarboniphaga sp.]|uniref:NAD(P)H-quinone oxidoreductase n=1 Tax=Hydrocarboniphaga sp. TaxID=2033016 RepID=UPI002AB87AEA|nr:NAD(P)H-quinone oxidoreductase [Hydrocarboniphaga sp.]MDZ4081118.1 NAD(P)H-quinone oxidoreductase [Hydrocarboniphaga sp.]